MADGSNTIDLDLGNNGCVKVEELAELGVQVLHESAKALGEPARALRLPGGAIVMNIIPPQPFSDGLGGVGTFKAVHGDKLTFAQSAVRVAAKLGREIADIDADKHLSELGKQSKWVPPFHSAYRGAAVCAMEVEREAEKADKALRDFYEPPAISSGDTVGPIVDAEARNYIRSLKPEEMGKLAQRLNETDDPRIVRALLGIVRSPLPLMSNLEQTALAVWRNYRERSEPERLASMQNRAALARWARDVTEQATNAVLAMSHAMQQRIGKGDAALARGIRWGLFACVDEDHTRHLLPRFGFQPMEADEIRRARAAGVK